MGNTVNLSKQTVNLSKSETVNLSKISGGNLKDVMVGLGWDPAKIGLLARLFGGQLAEYDLDAYVILLKDGKFSGRTSDIVYYKNLEYTHKGKDVIKHMGDDLTGRGAAKDKEQIYIDLSNLPKSVSDVVVAVTLYKGYEKEQSLGNVSNTFIRVVDKNDNFELCNYGSKVISEDFNAQSFIAGKFYKEGSDWQFKAIGESSRAKSILEVAESFR